MRAVLRKVVADLVGRPFQSALIALTVAAATALLYLGLITFDGARSPFDRQMEKADGAHAWFYVSDGEQGRALAGRIASLEEVSRAEPPRIKWVTRLLLPDGRTPRVDPVAVPPGRLPMDRYVVTQGRELQPGDQDAGVLDASYARYFGIKVGDQVQVITAAGPRPVTVIGLHVEPRMCSYPSCEGIHLYLLPETYASLAEGARKQYYQLSLQLKDPQRADRFLAAAKHLEGDGATMIDGLSWLRIRGIHRNEAALSTSLVLIVAVAAIFAAALITATIIGGAVLGQYREIGLLKAVGYTPAQVLLLFVGQNLVLALVGGAAGLGLGHLLVGRALAQQAFNMGAPELLGFHPGPGVLVTGTVALIAGLFAGLAAWRALSVRPHEALAGGVDRPSARVPPVVRWLTALRLPVPAVLGVKDAVARPGRLALTVVSLGVCLTTVALSLGATGLVNRVISDPAMIGINYDLQAGPGLLEPEQAVAAVAAAEGVQDLYTIAFRNANLLDHDTTFYLRGLGGGYDRFSFPIVAGRMLQGPDEIVLAPVIADRAGIKVGQRVRVQAEGEARELLVVGLYRGLDEGGQTALVSQETLARLAPSARVSAIFIRLGQGADAASVRQELLRQTGYQMEVRLETLEVPPWLVDALSMVKVLGLIMAGIAMLSVLNAALLTAREQMREVGVRKAIGMTPAQVLAGAASGGVWLGLLGALLGLPAGELVNRALVAEMSGIFGFNLAGNLPGLTLVLLLGLSVSLAVAASLPAALWAGRLSTARVLYAE